MTHPLSQATLPKDDPARNFTHARSDNPNLPHFGLVGDTYTILVAGKDTAGRYCLIDMHIPPGGGPRLIVTISKRCSLSWTVKSRLLSEEKRPSFEPAKPSTFQRTHLIDSKTRAGNRRDCYVYALQPGRKSFSKKWVFRWRREQRRHPHSTRRPRQRS
jgi:hypothetical protein